MASTGASGFTRRSFEFLEDLEENNNAEWFRTNKPLFTEVLHEPFADLLETLTERLQGTEVELQGSKTTMFRMNRDVRFSPDKSPYKTAVAGLLTPSGTKKEDAGLVYLHLGAEGSFVAGGLHTPTPTRLGPVRDKILEDPKAFHRVLDSLAVADLRLDTDASLRTMPRGYSEYADDPSAWALRLTSLIVQKPLPKSTWICGEVADRVEAFIHAVAPLLSFVRTQ